MAAHPNWHGHAEGHLPNATQISLPGSRGLILAFLALTVRHCRGTIREYLVPPAQDLDNATALSAYFASLTKRSLAFNDADGSRADVEGAQVRLMLALYDWSLGRSQQARQLLAEAVSLAGDIALIQDDRVKPGSGSISVAMAYEAESMGIQLRSGGVHDGQLEQVHHTEIARRTVWSLFLLDTQLALGDRRLKFVSNIDSLPPLPNTEAAFAGNAQTRILPDGERIDGWLRQHVPEVPTSELQSKLHYPVSASTELRPPLTPSISSTSSNSLHDTADGNFLSHYIRYVSLLHQIHVWAHSKPWRFVPHVPGCGLR